MTAGALVSLFLILAPVQLGGDSLFSLTTSTARAQGAQSSVSTGAAAANNLNSTFYTAPVTTGSNSLVNQSVVSTANPGGAAATANSTLGAGSFSSTVDGTAAANAAITAQQSTTAAQQAAAQTTSSAGDFSCSVTNVSLCLSEVVYAVTVGIATPFAYIGSSFLTIAVKLALQSTIYTATFVATGWTVARDMANITFLFVLIYISFIIMLRAETGTQLQTLGLVVVVALVVNFSFFATRVVIDTGNILAVEIYNAIPTDPNQCGGASYATGTTGVAAAANPACLMGGKDLTASIMGALNIQSLYGTDQLKKFVGNNNGISVFITLSILFIATAIILVILGFAFLTAGAQFLARIVALWFAIMVSPLALVCWAVPSKRAKDMYGKWQDTLIKNTFYPAIFLFVFLFLVLFMKGMTPPGGGQGGNAILSTFFNASLQSGASTSGANYIYMLATQVALMCIELGFVILMIKMALDGASKYAAQSAGAAKSFSNWVGGKYIGGARRVGGYAYQQVPGRLAANADKLMKNSRLGNTPLGYRLRMGILQPIAGASVGGVQSRTAVIKSEQAALTERTANIRDIENKAEIERILALSVPTDKDVAFIRSRNGRELGELSADQLEKLAPLFAKNQMDAVAKIAKLNDAQQGRISRAYHKSTDDLLDGIVTAVGSGAPLTADQNDRVKNIKAADFNRMSASAVATLIPKLDAKGMEELGKSEHNDADKTKFRANWQTNSEAAPHQLATTIAERLRKTVATGGKNPLGDDVGDLDTLVALGNVADGKKVQAALDNLLDKVADIQADVMSEGITLDTMLKSGATPAAIAAQRTAIKEATKKLARANNAVLMVKDFDEARKKTPAQVHGPAIKEKEVLIR